ncbi:lipoprotein-releasing ABC transporter permease subunit LolE [Thorsellia kenyensis]|uniref:Lipoprotein-releasing ABC transporter permease subunit LolE n=1 Tax=Thorsellia kenyensis TaxID=1549888 RepID=A0ABV6CB96_9GAMM
MLSLPFSLVTALRFSRAKKRGQMISLISFFSTLGITLGVAVLVIGLSAMNGFERELNNRVLAVIPHGEIKLIQPAQISLETLAKRVENNAGIVATAPFSLMTGLIENGTKIEAIQIKGIEPTKEFQISALPEYVTEGGWNQLSLTPNSLILGSAIANKINASVGDMVTIVIPSISPDNKLQQPKRIRLEIVGLMTLGGTIDQNLALINFQDALTYQEEGNLNVGVGIKVDDPFKAGTVIKDAAYSIGTPLQYDSWVRQYGYMYDDIQLIRTIMYFAMILVMSVACFNIVSTLVVAVKEKSKDIAVLKTLGATDKYILTIFLWYGLLSGFIGSVLGIVFGAICALYLTDLIKLLENISGVDFLSGDIYFVDFLPSELHYLDLVIVFTTSIVLSLLASIYPAKRAIKIEPARILSGM